LELNLTPEGLITAYANGIFPMGDPWGGISWYAPDPRAIIELDDFHVSSTLRQTCRQGRFELCVSRDFAGVIRACADRPDGSWITDEVIGAYEALHGLGLAHSVEAWQDGELAGGLYGVALGGAFFGESMFHRVRDASKVALVLLVERMRERGLVLLDIQYLTPHLKRFGAVEISRRDYLRRLRQAIRMGVSFADPPPTPSERPARGTGARRR